MKNIFKFLKVNNPKNRGFNSADYWNHRYELKGNSGAGSYGNLAVFKAKIINDFILTHNLKTVIELGCGDGNQLKLANYKEYIGFDVSVEALKLCSEIFKEDNSKFFLKYSEIGKKEFQSDVVLSLDVIYHLVEDDIYIEYMNNLFNLSLRYVIIYSSNYDQVVTPHVKCRKFTDWIESEKKNEFRLLQYIPNIFPYNNEFPETTSFSDFYIYEKIEN